jgi:hypothetical protein
MKEHILNNDRRGFSYYLKRMDEFSTLEARAYEKRLQGVSQAGLLVGRLFGSRVERRRFFKNLYIRMPFRAALIFVYLYIVRLGFLDGRPGFDYVFFKAISEWATTVKMMENRQRVPTRG